MRRKDSLHGLTPPVFEARTFGFLGFDIIALGILFRLPPIPPDLSYHAFVPIDGHAQHGAIG
ncbi:MAG TPA: hypothetical protein VH643_39975 [Gemmataceae bacterium]